MALSTIDLLRQQLTQLNGLHPTYDRWHQIEAWCLRTRTVLVKHFPAHLSDFDSAARVAWPDVVGAISLGTAKGGREDSAIRRKCDERAVRAKARIVAVIDSIVKLGEHEQQVAKDAAEQKARDERAAAAAEKLATLRAQAVNPTTPARPPTNSKIFVVHGHDEEMKQAAARTLSILELEPVILHEQPNAGRTIIEKFEVNADTTFAVVLLSPDDRAYPASGTHKAAKPRARQNVVLELGYFAGKLGRSRVFALKRGDDLELPSDLSGVVYTTYDGASGNWRFALVQELKEAGYTVDANRLLKTSG